MKRWSHVLRAPALCLLVAALGCEEPASVLTVGGPPNAGGPGPALAAKPVRSVVGSGVVDVRNDTDPPFPLDVVFQMNIAAFQDASGATWGTIEVNILRFLGDPNAPFFFKAEVNCVDVDGNHAWINGVVTASTFPDAEIGDEVAAHVRDLGGPGEDIMHEELAKFLGNPSCLDRSPFLAETVVDAGNYIVK